MNKIRILVAHNDENLSKEIVNSIQNKNLNYVKIVGITKNGEETYKKIIDLKPEIVFSEHQFNDMNSVDIMKMSKKRLGSEMPFFNIIGEMPENRLTEAISIINEKLITLIQKPLDFERINDIIENYNREKL